MLRPANTCFQEEKKISCKNLFELELRTAVTEQLHTNRTADIHSTVSYQPTKPTTQRDHLGLQIRRKKGPKRDPNDPTHKNSPHANGTTAHPTTQDPTPRTKTQSHNDCQNVNFRLESYLTCEPVSSTCICISHGVRQRE